MRRSDLRVKILLITGIAKVQQMYLNDSHVVLSEAVDWCICFTRKIQHGGDSAEHAGM